ncbi:hypothetical protein CLV56_0734 [Mumia flava]|uniref:Uncharacterized protein n=1 Tax=Mumia flava TaxID=1348852 RepID=A0A0B2BJG3_9ACTN|nr:hypothetical protein CLV56_0734 [Mumia flava]
MSTPVPRALTRSPLRTVRPKDLADVYRHPRAELARLTRAGVVRRLGHGYYVAIPDDRDSRWRPTLEAAAAGIAAAIYGPDDVALMGVSAARVHGALPRAVGTAVVATPQQHREVRLPGAGDGVVRFVMRDPAALDLEMRALDEIGSGLVTTVEQTVVDLARHGIPEVDAGQEHEVLRSLWRRADEDVVDEIAAAQRGRAAVARMRAVVE